MIAHTQLVTLMTTPLTSDDQGRENADDCHDGWRKKHLIAAHTILYIQKLPTHTCSTGIICCLRIRRVVWAADGSGCHCCGCR